MPYMNNNAFVGYNYPAVNPSGQFSNGMGMQQPQQETVIDWVMGKSGAEAYMLRPNTNGFLMDSNDNGETVYTKSTDMSGRYSPLRSFKMVPFEEQASAAAAEPIDYEKIREIISDEVAKQVSVISASDHKKGAK